MLAISKRASIEVTSSLTPTLDHTAQEIESATRAEQPNLRNSVRNMNVCSISFLTIFQVRKREDHRCAITGAFDRQLARRLKGRGRPIPSGSRSSLQAAHIIPLSFNKFTTPEVVGLDILYLLNLLTCPTA